VPGQHRNRALAQWRKARAVELAIDGASYAAIAAEVGYSHRGTAYKAVHKTLAERITEGVDTLRRLEVARLDTLQAALWPKALAGDTAAVNTVLRIIEQRTRMLSLGPESPAHRGTAQPSTVVVPDLASST
jgi:transposase-like protein